MKKIFLLTTIILLGMGCGSSRTSSFNNQNVSTTHFIVTSYEKNETIFDENDIESYNPSSYIFNLKPEALERIRKNFTLGIVQRAIVSLGNSNLFNTNFGTKNLLACDEECLGPIFIDITLKDKAQIIFESTQKEKEHTEVFQQIKNYFAS